MGESSQNEQSKVITLSAHGTLHESISLRGNIFDLNSAGLERLASRKNKKKKERRRTVLGGEVERGETSLLNETCHLPHGHKMAAVGWWCFLKMSCRGDNLFVSMAKVPLA